MYNILISSTNMNFIKNILFKLSNTIENIRIISIANTEKETISNIITGTIDIIIFDNNEKKLNILNILNNLSNYFIFPFPEIILLTSDSFRFKKWENNCNINLIISKQLDIDLIIKKIKNYILFLEEKFSQKYCEKKIFEELTSIGFKSTYKGTNFIVQSSILVRFCRNEDLSSNLEKYIYPIVARKYNTTTKNVKSNIQKTIYRSYQNGSSQTINAYFKVDKTSKVTPKFVISNIARKI